MKKLIMRFLTGVRDFTLITYILLIGLQIQTWEAKAQDEHLTNYLTITQGEDDPALEIEAKVTRRGELYVLSLGTSGSFGCTGEGQGKASFTMEDGSTIFLNDSLAALNCPDAFTYSTWFVLSEDDYNALTSGRLSKVWIRGEDYFSVYAPRSATILSELLKVVPYVNPNN